MNSLQKYLLDANVPIEAHRRYYSFDICPGFWDALITQHASKRVFSIDRIKLEIEIGKDSLFEWVETKAPSTIFLNSRLPDVRDQYRDLINWVHGEEQYTEAAKADFASGADGWLIAYALTKKYVVVTEEKHRPDIKRKVPIPNVCMQFGVLYINTFEMLTNLNVQFHLQDEKSSDE